MKCIVTGAAGFIGSMLCQELLSSGHEVIGIDSFTDYYDRRIKEMNIASLLDFDTFKLIPEDIMTLDISALLNDVEILYHQAAQAGVRASWGKSFEHYTHNNISATQTILESLKGTTVKLVYASSSSVYSGFPTALMFSKISSASALLECR